MAAIYLHIPFCRKKCSYCDFHFSTTFSEYRSRMVEAIARELEVRKGELDALPVKTIYFGGGTPSILNQAELQGLMEAIQSNFQVIDEPEVTLEANPEDIHAENLQMWRQAGVNRLSIGLQSFRQKDLDWMNRAHSVEEAKQAVVLAKAAGFENLTVDLIYGLPDLSLEEWMAHVQTVLQMDVPHVSAYCLTVEQKTVLHHRVKNGELHMPDDESQAAQFLNLIAQLAHAGLEQYEISNFAKPGWESKHNSSYWRGVPYLGVGPSAHSFRGNRRRWNLAQNRGYMEGVEKGTGYFEEEVLTPQDQFNETLLTGLRTREGVEKRALHAEFAAGEAFKASLRDFAGKAWLEEDAEWIRLTAEGKLRADWIASELFVQ